jgi:hypothetical protein
VNQGQQYSQHKGAGRKRTKTKESMSVVEQQTASRPVQGSTTPANYGSFDAFLKAFGVPLAIAAAVAIWLVETPRGLPIEGHKALALFGSIFVFYLSEGIPLAIASLLVVPTAVQRSLLERRRESKMPQIAAIRCGRARYGVSTDRSL